MQYFSSSPVEMLSSLMRNRELIFVSVRREILTRYKGSFLGLSWSFIFPLLMLSVYTFVFSEVFKAKWHPGSQSKTEFAIVLFSGLIVFTLFAESITRAPSTIVANANYVKKIVFPLEILPWIIVANSLFHALVSLCVWLFAYLVFFGLPPWTIVLLPIIWLPLILLIVGLCWFLASVGVYVRDVGQIIGVFTTALMFLSPVFYPASAIPSSYQALLYANPLTFAVELTRDVLIWGKLPTIHLIAISWFFAIMIAWLGFAWFQKTRDGFADVL